MFKPRAGNCGDDVGEAGPGGNKGEGAPAITRLIEILRRNPCRNLVNGRDAGEPCATTVKQVHGVAAGNEETVGEALADEDVSKEVGVGVAAVGRHAKKLGESA